jgi:hypothetical protein
VTTILAHGISTRQDLPIPFWLAQYGGAFVLLVSFTMLGLLWRSPRFETDGGRPLPEPLQRLADAPATRVVLRMLGLLGAAATLVTALVGSQNPVVNPAPTWLYVWLWVGLVPVLLLLGPVWRALNPLRTLAAGLARLSGDRDEQGVRQLPERVGYWPAAAGLLAFTWLELVHPEPALPQTVLIFLVLYGVVQLGAAMRWGQAWFERGDAFEVWSTLIGHLAFVGRTRDGGPLVLRSPLRGLAAVPEAPGLVAVVCVMLGSTGFDGLSGTGWWGELLIGKSEAQGVLLGCAGLAFCIGVVAAVYLAAVAVSAALAADGGPGRIAWLARRFAPSLVPIAVGYTIAHYFSLLAFQGQAGYILASDPLGRGWDLFGTAGWAIDMELVSARVIAVVQVLAIVTGHVLGVVAAHDRAVGLFPPAQARRGQVALLVAMVGFTITGIGLLLS